MRSKTVLAGSVIEVSAMFFLCFQLSKIGGYEIGERSWQLAYLLWTTNFLTLSLIQMVLIQWKDGYKWSFLLIMLMAGMSIYIWKMPGSIWMLRRSEEMMEGGYSVGLVLIVQWTADILIGLWGYRIRRSR